MASYTLYSANSYQGRKLRLYCTSTINIAENTSTINWTLYSEGGSSNYYTTGPTTVEINGVQVYYKDQVGYSKKIFPASKGSVSGSITVPHNSDGSKSIDDDYKFDLSDVTNETLDMMVKDFVETVVEQVDDLDVISNRYINKEKKQLYLCIIEKKANQINFYVLKRKFRMKYKTIKQKLFIHR